MPGDHARPRGRKPPSPRVTERRNQERDRQRRWNALSPEERDRIHRLELAKDPDVPSDGEQAFERKLGSPVRPRKPWQPSLF